MYKSFKRHLTLIGKHLLRPADLTSISAKAILWTAFELKKLSAKSCLALDKRKTKVVLLMHGPSVFLQTVTKRATNLIGLDLTTVIDEQWENVNAQDLARYFSMHSDVILCQTDHQLKLNHIAVHSKTPFVCIRSYIYDIIRVLSDMMTLQEHFGYLNHLNLACVGSPCGRINTYLCIAPKLGLNVQFYCCCGMKQNQVSPATLPEVKRACCDSNVQLQECVTPAEVLKRAHVVVTSSRNPNDLTITREDLKVADPECVVLHGLPRGEHELDKEVYESQRNLVWKSSVNMEYVLAAVILRVMRKYDHITEKPDFEKLRSTL